MPTDAEILRNFREWSERQSAARPGSFVPLRNDPHHVGVIDAAYVRPAPSDFPKAAYKRDANAKEGYVTRVVKSQEEQDALPKGWLTSVPDVHALLESIGATAAGPPEPAAAEAEEPPKSSKKGK